MFIEKVEEFVKSLNGKKVEKVWYENKINSVNFRIELKEGYLQIETYELKGNLPDYDCVKKRLHGKFGVTYFKNKQIVHITEGLVDINEENLNKYIDIKKYDDS